MMNQGCVPARTVVSIALGILLLAGGASPQSKDLRLPQPTAQRQTISQSCANAIDYVDPTYGSKIRQLRRSDGHEHNMYFHRNPWNADGSYMMGIQSDLQQKNWRVVLQDGDGCFLKELFTIDQYDWKVVWDRNHPEILYTWKGSTLYKYNVTTQKAEPLKSFAPVNRSLKPNGPSLNQAGDRILMITSDGTFRSYRISDMQEERSFKVTFPPNCSSNFGFDTRYIGYKNYIVTHCSSQDFTQKHTFIYDDTGKLFHHFNGRGSGHTDFSPDGRWAYLKWRRGSTPLEIRVVKIDGTDDRILYQVPQTKATYVQGLHISWPDRISDWFIVSFFPVERYLPPTYAPLLDEILLINASSGKYRFLARTETSAPANRAMFWSQPLASPSSDGSRISFNSNRSGTIDQYILWVPKPLVLER